MEQMDHMRQSQSQIPGQLFEDALGGGVAGFKRAGKVSRLAALPIIQELAKHARRASPFKLPDFMVHSPPRTTSLQHCSFSIQTHMPDFSLARPGAMIYFPLHHH